MMFTCVYIYIYMDFVCFSFQGKMISTRGFFVLVSVWWSAVIYLELLSSCTQHQARPPCKCTWHHTFHSKRGTFWIFGGSYFLDIKNVSSGEVTNSGWPKVHQMQTVHASKVLASKVSFSTRAARWRKCALQAGEPILRHVLRDSGRRNGEKKRPWKHGLFSEG